MSQTTSAVSTWTTALRQAVLLSLVALIATVGLWLLRSEKLPLNADDTSYELELSAPLVSLDEALQLYDEGNHLFIDTRNTPATDGATIPGSFLIRSDHFDDDLQATVQDMYPEDPLILYGSGNLTLVNNVASRLLERGYSDLLILRGGIGAWQSGGGEISNNRPKDPS